MRSQTSLDDFLQRLEEERNTDFCIRPTQETMMRQVWHSLEEELISFIEAPTGTGKSLAYLIPSLLFTQDLLDELETKGTLPSKETLEPIVISTATLTLQNQLIEKDIPTALQLIHSPNLTIFVLKGRTNYLCKKLLNEFLKRQRDLTEAQGSQLQYICEWAQLTQWGDKEELPFSPDAELWIHICAEANTCASLHCSRGEDCFFYRNKRQASKATLIVVNHALLANDLVIKSKQGLENEFNAVLPPFKRLIIDEAHKFPYSLESAYAFEFSYPLLHKLLKRIDPKRKGNILYTQLLWDQKTIRKVEENLRETKQTWKEADIYLTQYFSDLPNEDPFLKRASFRVLNSTLWESPTYRNYLDISSNAFCALKSLSENLKELQDSIKGKKEREADLAELNSLYLELNQFIKSWDSFLQQDLQEDVPYARWLKINSNEALTYISYHLHPMELSSILNKKIYPFLQTLVFTSATLSVNGSFHSFSQTLGLENEEKDRLNALTLPSGFCPSRVYFCGPYDFPTPENQQAYLDYALPAIQHLVSINPYGGTLVLTTSYELVAKIADYLHTVRLKVPIYGQNTQISNKQLLDQFKQNKPSLLIATDSFWEGIDLAGDFLTLLIIAKLPFANPANPLHYTKKQYLQQIKRKNPFAFYDLPQAVLKFKQGFGRLMRQKDDWGAIVCLDSRLQTKSYGKTFLQSLHPHRFHSQKGEGLMQQVEKYLSQQNYSNQNPVSKKR